MKTAVHLLVHAQHGHEDTGSQQEPVATINARWPPTPSPWLWTPARRAFSRIAGDSVSVRDIAAMLSDLTGERYRPLWAGSPGTLGLMIRMAKLIAPQPGAVFPPWQGMQYMRDQFDGRVEAGAARNNRYPGLGWTSVREHLARIQHHGRFGS